MPVRVRVLGDSRLTEDWGPVNCVPLPTWGPPVTSLNKRRRGAGMGRSAANNDRPRPGGACRGPVRVWLFSRAVLLGLRLIPGRRVWTMATGVDQADAPTPPLTKI